MAPELELNEILWKSVRGADSPMPPPVRAGFIRVIDDDDDEADGEVEADEDKGEGKARRAAPAAPASGRKP